ncbi:MAG: DUF5689 domain-containing protein [Bacteroidales bacterium]|jgi:hypothetical protein|nr:DUF5689 domain-containing protein [Bacteroidales bacterium]MCI2145111.1 DUF5689 domain-containing protein [Bacteroidales bacterium]
MKLNRLTNILALACAALVLWGCPKNVEQEDPKIDVSPKNVILENTAGTQTVTVASNRAWTVDFGGADWITATPSSVSSDETKTTEVTLTVTANDGAARETTVNFKTSTVYSSVKITQKGASGGETTITPISDLWSTYGDQVSTSGASVTLGVDITVKGRVLSNIDPDTGGNVNNKSMYIEDGTDSYSGICVRYASSGNNVLAQGDEVEITMDGGTISNYSGTIQLTPLSDDDIVKTSSANEVQAPVAVAYADMMKYQSMYIATPKVQVVDSDLSGTMSGAVSVQTENGDYITMYSGTSSSQTAAWTGDNVPQGAGILYGIFTPYGSSIEVLPQTRSDFAGLTGERFTVGGGEATLTSIAAVRDGGYNGSIDDDIKISGTVTSNAALKVNSYSTVFMQDGTSENSGIMLYLKKSADNTFSVGDEIEVKLKGSKFTVYNGSDEIALSDDANITVTSSTPAPVDPVIITADQLRSENAKWQSMYVKIGGVQVVSDSLGKNMTGNTPVENTDGTQFTMYTRAGSVWADIQVPQGSGDLCGVASIYKGSTGDPVYQVIPQNETDWNGLTGERFTPGSPVEPQRKSIAEVRAMKPSSTSETVTISDDIYVVGTVVTDNSNNFSAYGICIEDGEEANCGMYIYPKSKISGYAIGDEVKVNLKDATISYYKGLVEFTVSSTDAISKTETANSPKSPVKIDYSQYISGDYEGMYVEIDGVQVIDEDLTKTMYTSSSYGNVNCVTSANDTLVMFNNKGASWKDETVPQGSGNLCGVISKYNVAEIVPQIVSDWNGLTGERFTPGSPAEPQRKSIAEVRAMKPSSTSETVTISDDIYVVGTVVTDNSNNFSAYGICIEDGEEANCGMYIYPKSKISGYAIGDEVKVNLKDATISYYKGLVEFTVSSTDAISKTETANSPKSPVKIDYSQYISGDYEGMYVEIDGVQVIDEDLTKTMYTSSSYGNVNCVTSANDTLVMFNNKGASWKDETVPQGSGNLCGVISKYNVAEIVPQIVSDWNGLTGERFTPATKSRYHPLGE